MFNPRATDRTSYLDRSVERAYRISSVTPPGESIFSKMLAGQRIIAVAVLLASASVVNAQNEWAGSPETEAGSLQARSRFMLQVDGDQEVSLFGVKATSDVEDGFSVGIELLYGLHRNVQLGAWYEVQFGRAEQSTSGKIDFDQVYATVRTPFPLSTLTAYAVGRLGYGSFFGDWEYRSILDLKDGLYYGGGLGVDFLRIGPGFLFLEVGFAVNEGGIGASSTFFGELFADVRYSRIDVTLGYSNVF